MGKALTGPAHSDRVMWGFPETGNQGRMGATCGKVLSAVLEVMRVRSLRNVQGPGVDDWCLLKWA